MYPCMNCLQTWYAQEDAKQEVKTAASVAPTESGPDFQIRVMALCKKGKGQGEK